MFAVIRHYHFDKNASAEIDRLSSSRMIASMIISSSLPLWRPS